MRAELTVKEILQPNILRCPPETSVADAARRMVEARCSSILVEADGQVMGIWTEQDAVALDLADPAQHRQPIAGVMSSPIKTLDIDTPLGEAALRFRDDGIRHYLVVDAAGRPKGIVSQSDIVINQGIEYFVSLREVASVFNRRYRVIPGGTPVTEAVRGMHQGRFDAVIVNGAEGAYGILTERDVVRLIGAGAAPATVQEAASYPLVTLPLTASLYHARKQFAEHRVRHLGVTDDDGELVGLVTFADILANIEYEYVRHLREALRESEHHLAASNHRLRLAAKAFESTHEGILVTNIDGVIESVNPAFTRITGYSADEAVGRTPALLASGRHDAAFYREMFGRLAESGHWQGEIFNRRKSGEIYVEWLTINAVKDSTGRVTNYVAVFADFTSRKAEEEHMRFLAQHDALTGLPNRALLKQRLLRAVRHAQRNGRMVAVIFMDLDEFKEINDRHGHSAGDQMLRTVAGRLSDSLRGEDTVARLGGDEFVLVLEELADASPLPGIVRKLMDALAEPLVFDGRELRTSASIGVSVFPQDGRDPDELIKHADVAMYRSKEEGRNRFCFYSG